MGTVTQSDHKRAHARQSIAEMKGRLAWADRRARSLSREHPFLVLTGALMFGFVIGRVASRS